MAPTEHIAILDDDASLRKALGRVLEAYSYRVQTYGTAQEFVDSLRVQVPACLIVDLQLGGMAGMELQHHLADTGTAIPTIVLTAHDTREIRERCLEVGAVAFLVKPVGIDQLVSAIAAAIGRNESHAAS